jgi:hypothetical protein
MIDWKRQILSDVTLYTGSDGFNDYEIRSWPTDESGEGRFQLCVDDYHKANFKTLKEAKKFAEMGY